MNDIIRALTERRSVRAYRPEQISDAELNEILTAGLYAPSGMNRQPVVLVAVQDKAVRDRLSAMNAAVMGRAGSDPFYGAPTVVVVLADRSVSGTALEDGCLALGNMMNAAHALGIGSCWIHRAREEFESAEGKALLAAWGLRGDWIGVGHCILGYAADSLPEAKERRPGRVIRV
ncbi:MAG: nitroreductase family protein [Eubacteriales bacterium]